MYFFIGYQKLQSFKDISSLTDIAVFREPLIEWFKSYEKVCEKEESTFEQRNKIMSLVNPKFTIKNYMLQEAIMKAHDGDYSLVNDLLNIAQNPFDEHEEFERYANPTPMEHANLQLSCSS